MMELGTVRPSDSKWASPLRLVKKSKPGNWRPCGDYRALNSDTIPDRYPLPHIHDCVASRNGMKVFSTIDLVSAYQQIPVATEDVPKTAITTNFGSVEFPRMPFGLRNAPPSHSQSCKGIPQSSNQTPAQTISWYDQLLSPLHPELCGSRSVPHSSD